MTHTFNEVYNKFPIGALLSPLWAIFLTQFNDFATDAPVIAVVLLWFIDFIFGISLAIRNKVFDKNKMQKSFKKLFGYLVFLLVARIFRVTGLWMASLPVETALIITEGTSVLVNGADLSGEDSLKQLSKSLKRKTGNENK